jgi:hypothetical protein
MPLGMGRAGWAYVYGYPYPGLSYPAWNWWGGRRGWGRGRGRGLGWHRWWCIPPYIWPWPSIPKEDEIAVLEDHARVLERELDSIRKILEELKKQEVKNA